MNKAEHRPQSSAGEYAIIASDDPAFRDGLLILIQYLTPQIRPLVAGSLEQARATAHASTRLPRLLLLDLNLSRKSIWSRLTVLCAEFDTSTLVVLSNVDDDCTIDRVMASGASGFISKSAPPAEMIAQLRQILAGDAVAQLPAESK